MPQNQAQRAFFAFITVLVTVHAYVFYSLYVVNGSTLMEVNHASSVIKAINHQGGVYMFGKFMPIWAVIIIEFVLAYSLEMLLGSPCSFKLASKCFDPRNTHPVLFETAIICSTVGIMCPAMSFIAAWLYYPYYAGFNFFTLLANWLKLVCFNFPFAFFSQLFFIQPFVRTVFKTVYVNGIGKLTNNLSKTAVETIVSAEVERTELSQDVIVDVMQLVDQIKEKLEAQYK